MNVDTGDLREWADTLGRAADEILPQARKVVAKAALNIKQDAKRAVSGLAHAPAYPSSISYDTRQGGTWVEAEVGPDKSRRQGPLGNLIEFGSINNAPIPHMAPATDREVPAMVGHLEALCARLLER